MNAPSGRESSSVSANLHIKVLIYLFDNPTIVPPKWIILSADADVKKNRVRVSTKLTVKLSEMFPNFQLRKWLEVASF